MASPPDESADSRTQRVGRKRALQDSSQQSREVISLLDSSDDESAPPSKRPRQDSATPSGATTLKEVDLTASLGQASNAQSLSAPESFTSGPLPTWNKGVQGGLRTSFGSKNRVSTVSEATQRPPRGVKIENDGHASSGKPSLPISFPMERSQEHQDANEEMPAIMRGTEDTQQSNTSGSLPNQQQKSVSFVPEPKKEPRTRSRKRQEDSQQALPARPKDNAQKEKGKLPPEKKKKKIPKDDKLQLATNTADQAIDRFGWPLPKELENIKTAISKGKTFYPYSSGEDQRYVYHFDNFKFILTEVLNEEGKPIRLQDITLPIFSQWFLEVNIDVVNTIKDGKLTQKRLSAAFNSYISNFYSHCMKSFDNDAKGTIKSVPDMVKKAKDSIEAKLDKLKKRAVAQAPLLVSSDDYYKLDKAGPMLPKSDTSDVDDTGMDDVDEADRAEDGHELGEVDDEMDVVEMEEVVDEVENALLQKYFPPAPTNYPRQRCFTCASTRHITKHCPELTCGSCGVRGVHVTSACPETIRCLKCFVTGHKTKECPEKLRAVQTEVRACDICKSTAHTETKCHHIWRTHIRDETKKVRNIRVDCYSCGAEGHYGPECGLHQGKLLSGGLTWSRSNLHLYLDSSSQDRAISAGIDYSIPNRAPKGFSIKGKASDPILLDGNNSDENDFLRPKVPRGPKHGAIIMGQTQHQDRPYQNNPQSRSEQPSLDDSARYGRESTGDFEGSANGSAATARKRGPRGEGGRGGANRGKGRKRNDRARTVGQTSARRR